MMPYFNPELRPEHSDRSKTLQQTGQFALPPQQVHLIPSPKEHDPAWRQTRQVRGSQYDVPEHPPAQTEARTIGQVAITGNPQHKNPEFWRRLASEAGIAERDVDPKDKPSHDSGGGKGPTDPPITTYAESPGEEGEESRDTKSHPQDTTATTRQRERAIHIARAAGLDPTDPKLARGLEAMANNLHVPIMGPGQNAPPMTYEPPADSTQELPQVKAQPPAESLVPSYPNANPDTVPSPPREDGKAYLFDRAGEAGAADAARAIVDGRTLRDLTSQPLPGTQQRQAEIGQADADEFRPTTENPQESVTLENRVGSQDESAAITARADATAWKSRMEEQNTTDEALPTIIQETTPAGLPKRAPFATVPPALRDTEPPLITDLQVGMTDEEIAKLPKAQD